MRIYKRTARQSSCEFTAECLILLVVKIKCKKIARRERSSYSSDTTSIHDIILCFICIVFRVIKGSIDNNYNSKICSDLSICHIRTLLAGKVLRRTLRGSNQCPWGRTPKGSLENLVSGVHLWNLGQMVPCRTSQRLFREPISKGFTAGFIGS